MKDIVELNQSLKAQPGLIQIRDGPRPKFSSSCKANTEP